MKDTIRVPVLRDEWTFIDRLPRLWEVSNYLNTYVGKQGEGWDWEDNRTDWVVVMPVSDEATVFVLKYGNP